MIVVVSSSGDQTAARLVRRWGRDAVCLTPADLTRAGWRFDPRSPVAGDAVVDGQVVPTTAIEGVFTRLPYVSHHELGQIAADDRDYVARETTAFLLAWLAGLPCPVVNRPTPGCLAGPNWPPARWRLAASRLGMPTRARHQRGAGARRVTVIGGRCVNEVESDVAVYARRLADLSAASALSVEFSDSAIVSASPWVDVRRASIADALLTVLIGEPRR